jgi:hypothetical protein
MSELLYDWLNKKVRMLPKIEEIRKDFSTGYRYGELLNKLALISNSDFNQNYKCKFTLMRTAVSNTEYMIRDTVDQLGDRVG